MNNNMDFDSEMNFLGGIIFGLVIGILGNLIVTTSYDIFIKNSSDTIKFWIIFISLILVLVIEYLVIKNMFKLRKIEKYS